MKGTPPSQWQNSTVQQSFLPVDAHHNVHWRTYGNSANQAVLFLHGGPGSGADVSHLCFFDPNKHYVVFFDQRGSGQSTPAASLVNNTTQHLIQDIERVRTMLGVEHWVVFGGSWGATLGLLYAQHCPRSCQSLILRGVSNSHAFQNRWIMVERPKLLPERLQAFLYGLPTTLQNDPVRAHLDNILSNDTARQAQAMYAIRALETGLSDGVPIPFTENPPQQRESLGIEQDELSRATLYLHYWINRKFLDHNECLPTPAALNAIPITFVHGESDWICPLAGVQLLCKVLTHATLITVAGAGHSPFHAQMTHQLKRLMR